MKKVICTDDSNQPLGANAVKNESYCVESEYVNALDQKVYIIVGLNNKGRTKLGMVWKGYNANRFSNLEDFVLEKAEVNERELILN
jgi:hypothetical protein